MKPQLDSTTCLRIASTHESALLVDARAYYKAFVAAARRARRSILLTGWQFDTEVILLRGEDAPPGPPVRLVEFLNQLCDANTELEVHLLAWDYSLIYVLEREWLQSLKLKLNTHPRVHFEYWTHPNPGGAHHHKYTVIDHQIAFVGGMDLCTSRWDDRTHAAGHPLRVNDGSTPYKPFHDLQLAITGEAVKDIRKIFSQFWAEAASTPLPTNEPLTDTPPALADIAPDGLALAASRIGISRTEYRGDDPPVIEVEQLLTGAIQAAEQLIYIENQYFTSRAIVRALHSRLADESRSKLDLVIIMPNGADSPKEDFVLGDRQRAVRYALTQMAAQNSHRIRFLYSSDQSSPEEPVSTFIHAKLLIVDDLFLSIGSANLTNRSMRVDSELNLSMQADPDTLLANQIQRVRASLLGEHAGTREWAELCSQQALLGNLDRLVADKASKLQAMAVPKPDDDDPLLIAIFDPGEDYDLDGLGKAIDEELALEDGLFRTALRKMGQRFGMIDVV